MVIQSIEGCAASKQGHILADSEKRWQHGQCEVAKQAIRATYFLKVRVGGGSDMVSIGLYSKL